MATNLNISGSLTVGGGVQLSNLTGSKVLISDSDKNIIESFIDANTLSYLSGCTGNIQNRIDIRMPITTTNEYSFDKNTFTMEDIANNLIDGWMFSHHIGNTDNTAIEQEIHNDIGSGSIGDLFAYRMKGINITYFCFWKRYESGFDIFCRMYVNFDTSTSENGFKAWRKLTLTTI